MLSISVEFSVDIRVFVIGLSEEMIVLSFRSLPIISFDDKAQVYR